MRKTQRIGAFIAAATAALGVAAPAIAAPRGPQPVSNWLQSVRAGAGSWVTIDWRTDRPVCDAEIRVRGDRVQVGYSGLRRSATFSRGASLRPGRTDFTKIRVTPHVKRPGITKLWATISYDECGPKARTQTRTAVLSLPVLRHTGPGGQGGPGGPGHGSPGGSNHDGPGAPGHAGPGQGHEGPQDSTGPGQGGPGQHTPGAGQGTSGDAKPPKDHQRPGGTQPQDTKSPAAEPQGAGTKGIKPHGAKTQDVPVEVGRGSGNQGFAGR
ncbi:hypothetical protein [Actinoplanes derwentensis]|uniref:Uncharacterized protein n=1 Tax=Actinoplanes derwentensis TaxID=113562 RepID=A0A1H2CF19_9ACTN|nr:hypothetical protein [Actinoplanes derwentensis]GID86051.1 hypothetical protein Ade03nite_49750 [Actinoplanes derwentensis]SDT68909.1 hypothetical protein SAMN04489716_5693 [Actinoplanes derwentensis]